MCILLFNVCRFKAARVTDNRVKVMNEVISGIRVIKMYGWEYAFSRLVARIRRYGIYNNKHCMCNASISN